MLMQQMKLIFSRFWIPIGGILIALLYLPMLAAPFDFIDDGNLVYPSGATNLSEWLAAMKTAIVANYDHLGAFRPTLWFHWLVQQHLLGPNELPWHVYRLLWCALAAGMFLWFLKELGFRKEPALFIAALAMWNRIPNEIWMSLTLGEGVAMPYAMLALIAARRASRSSRPWAWDIAAALGLLVALGCKNTFVALLPAMVVMRVLPDRVTIREGIRRNWKGVMILCLPLIMPIAHYIYFKTHWKPGQYVTQPPSLSFVGQMLSVQLRASSLDFLAPGLVLCIAAIIMAKRGAGATSSGDAISIAPSTPPQTHRAAFIAGVLLFIFGMAIYLPINAYGGRYAIPAVWGAYLTIAVFLATVIRLKASRATQVAWIALIGGLIAIAIASIGKQEKLIARANMLWQAVEWVEKNVPADTAIAWLSGDSDQGALNIEEGIHFQWHLDFRGKKKVRVLLYDESWKPLNRVEIDAGKEKPELAIWGKPVPATAPLKPDESFVTTYRFGAKQYECHLGRRAGSASARP
ncbi:MAG: hypothetical protein WD768_03985 [Phycisphaeraceae bacterium]